MPVNLGRHVFDGNIRRIAQASHRKGANRRSRHGRQDAIQVPLEEDDFDASGIAHQLMQQAQVSHLTLASLVLQALESVALFATAKSPQ